jgi:hypothetical protein
MMKLDADVGAGPRVVHPARDTASADLDEVFEQAVRSGLHTPERLDWMRRHGIRPATQQWQGPSEPVKLRPGWLAFLLRTADRLMGRR